MLLLSSRLLSTDSPIATTPLCRLKSKTTSSLKLNFKLCRTLPAPCQMVRA